MKYLVNLGLLLAILSMSVGVIFAQDDETLVTFTSDDGKFSFQHPPTWIITELPVIDEVPSKLRLSIDAYNENEAPIFYAEGGVLNASKTAPSPFVGPRLSDDVWSVVDYISYDERYYDYELREGWDDIEVLHIEGQPNVAYVCSCELRRTIYFAVALENGNYFTLDFVFVYYQDMLAVRDAIIEVLQTMTYEQQTIYEDFIFPEPIEEDASTGWRISTESYLSVRGSAIDSEDNIYVFSTFAEPQRMTAMVVLDRNGKVNRIIDHPEMAGNDTAIGLDGSIWITDGSIHHFTSNGEFIETINHASAGWEVVVDISGFSDIAVDLENNLIALNTWGDASVVVFSPEGELIHLFEIPFANSPEGSSYDWLAILNGDVPSLHVTNDQVIYVHNPRSGQVHAYDLEGNELETELITVLTNTFPMRDTPVNHRVENGISYFYYGADGLFYAVGSAYDINKPYGIYIFDQTGNELEFVQTGDIEFEGTIGSQFHVLSDGSMVTIHSEDIVRFEPIH